jgi:hypothetical protein
MRRERLERAERLVMMLAWQLSADPGAEHERHRRGGETQSADDAERNRAGAKRTQPARPARDNRALAYRPIADTPHAKGEKTHRRADQYWPRRRTQHENERAGDEPACGVECKTSVGRATRATREERWQRQVMLVLVRFDHFPQRRCGEDTAGSDLASAGQRGIHRFTRAR